MIYFIASYHNTVSDLPICFSIEIELNNPTRVDLSSHILLPDNSKELTHSDLSNTCISDTLFFITSSSEY